MTDTATTEIPQQQTDSQTTQQEPHPQNEPTSPSPPQPPQEHPHPSETSQVQTPPPNPPPNPHEFPQHPHQYHPPPAPPHHSRPVYTPPHYAPPPYYHQPQIHVPHTPPPPPLTLSAAFMREWSTPRPYERVIRVTYMVQGTTTAYDERHKLFIPPRVVLDLSELQGHAQMCGWPHMPIRLWLELAFEPEEGDRYITSCVCRPPEMTAGNPQMAVVMQEIEALKAQAPEKEKTWFDQFVDFVLQHAPLIKVWFEANWHRIKAGIKSFIEWIAGLFKAAESSPAIPATPQMDTV